jgi:thiamine-phosphate pyrophosphorylase
MMPYESTLRSIFRQRLVALEKATQSSPELATELELLRRTVDSDAHNAEFLWDEHDLKSSLDQALKLARQIEWIVAELSSLGAILPNSGSDPKQLIYRITTHLGRMYRLNRGKQLQGLYVILDPELARKDPLKVAEEALKGGASAIQWRDKKSDKGDQLSICHRLKDLCQRYEALFIVNDHADLAVASGAHGLHLGQHDLPIEAARRMVPLDMLVGRSNATLKEAKASERLGADYVAVGAIFPTTTKSNTRTAGLETLRMVAKNSGVPVVAISGINEDNVRDVIRAGADAVAVISAVVSADDPGEAARRLVYSIEDITGKQEHGKNLRSREANHEL